MMRKILAATMMWFSASGITSAQTYSSDASPETIGTIAVELTDNAENGCWTNLKETREYAEEKLRLSGYNVVQTDSKFTFAVRVNASRDGTGWCVSTITIEVYRFVYHEGMSGGLVIGQNGALFVKKTNVNVQAIETVQQMINAM